MKKLYHIFIGIALMLSVSPLSAFIPNGAVITLAGDTLECYISKGPKEFRLKRQLGAYYYDYVVAQLKKDSLRIYTPEQIKGYYYRWDNNGVIQTERYFSDSIDWRRNTLIPQTPVYHPVFLKRLVTGGEYHLWFFEENDPGEKNTRCFILEEAKTHKREFVNSHARMGKLLPACSGFDPGSKKYKHWYKGKQWMVIDYNKCAAGK